MSLACQETLWEDEDNSKDSGCSDLSFDGIMSVMDTSLVRDGRVLENVLLATLDKRDTERSYFDTVQTEIKPHMRKIVCDWMLEVCEEQQCQADVFPLAVDYLDRTLAKVDLRKSQFQLLGAVCIFVASKFKETSPVCADKLVVYADFSITTAEITRWELLLLDILGWDMSCSTPLTILDQLLHRLVDESDTSASPFDLKTVRKHSEIFLSLMATDHAYCHAPRPLLAVSCLLAAFNGLKRTEEGIEYVDNLASNLCLVADISPGQIAAGVAVVETMIQERIPTPKQTNATVAVAAAPKSGNVRKSSQASTTPTDVMDISVY